MKPRDLIGQWLVRQLPNEAISWLEQAGARAAASSKDTDLYTVVSLVVRKIGKSDLALTDDDLRAADGARAGWNPRHWSADQAARIHLLLALEHDAARFQRCFDQLCITADVSELAAFYRGLPLYPDAPRYLARTTEGLRTNMKNVFESIAHRNPYPSEQFSEPAWNQMVLKALFVGSTLAPIVGLDRRANADLARMLIDYAHERWAAGRPISPELWRCVGPHARGAMVDDLAKVLKQGTEPERNAAALALSASPDEAAAGILTADPARAAALKSGKLSWEQLAPAA